MLAVNAFSADVVERRRYSKSNPFSQRGTEWSYREIGSKRSIGNETDFIDTSLTHDEKMLERQRQLIMMNSIQSIDHPKFSFLKKFLVVYGLWRPNSNKKWLCYQLTYFLLLSLFTVLCILVVLNKSLDKKINNFFGNKIFMPARFSSNAILFVPSFFVNILPVISYISLFSYFNHHLTWKFTLPTNDDTRQGMKRIAQHAQNLKLNMRARYSNSSYTGYSNGSKLNLSNSKKNDRNQRLIDDNNNNNNNDDRDKSNAIKKTHEKQKHNGCKSHDTNYNVKKNNSNMMNDNRETKRKSKERKGKFNLSNLNINLSGGMGSDKKHKHKHKQLEDKQVKQVKQGNTQPFLTSRGSSGSMNSSMSSSNSGSTFISTTSERSNDNYDDVGNGKQQKIGTRLKRPSHYSDIPILSETMTTLQQQQKHQQKQKNRKDKMSWNNHKQHVDSWKSAPNLNKKKQDSKKQQQAGNVNLWEHGLEMSITSSQSLPKSQVSSETTTTDSGTSNVNDSIQVYDSNDSSSTSNDNNNNKNNITYDTMVHFGILLNEIQILDSALKHDISMHSGHYEARYGSKFKKFQFKRIFFKRIYQLGWTMLFIEIIFTLIDASVQIVYTEFDGENGNGKNTESKVALLICTHLMFYLLLLIQSSSLFMLCYIIYIICMIHKFQLSYLFYLIDYNYSLNLFQFKSIIIEIHRTILLTSQKFALILTCNSIVPLIVLICILLFDSNDDQEKKTGKYVNIWTNSKYAWLWMILFLYFAMSLFQLYCCSSVTSKCDELIVRIYHRQTLYLAENTNFSNFSPNHINYNNIHHTSLINRKNNNKMKAHESQNKQNKQNNNNRRDTRNVNYRGYGDDDDDDRGSRSNEYNDDQSEETSTNDNDNDNIDDDDEQEDNRRKHHSLDSIQIVRSLNDVLTGINDDMNDNRIRKKPSKKLKRYQNSHKGINNKNNINAFDINYNGQANENECRLHSHIDIYLLVQYIKDIRMGWRLGPFIVSQKFLIQVIYVLIALAVFLFVNSLSNLSSL